MEKIKFPWIEDEKPAALTPSETVQHSNWSRYYYLFKPYLPYMLLLCILFSVSFFRSNSDAPASSAVSRGPKTLPVVISLVHIPKGSAIPPEALDIVEVKASSLSKSQTLRAFTPEQLAKLSHKIVAKKDIPSQVPIFWNDLQLFEEKKPSAPSRKTEILF